jgi:hypothetical protein
VLRNKLAGQVFTLSCRIRDVGILTGCGFVGNWYRCCGRLWVASRHSIPAMEAKEFSEADDLEKITEPCAATVLEIPEWQIYATGKLAEGCLNNVEIRKM